MIIKCIKYCLVLQLFISCSKNIVEDNASSNVFNVFWEIMDERYVFFEEKNINWDSIYTEYAPLFQNTTEKEMKHYFNQIVQSIKDGHVLITYNSNECSCYSYSNKRGISINHNMLFFYYNMTKFSVHPPVTMAQLPNSIVYLWIENMRPTDIDMSIIENSLLKYDYSNGIIVDVRDNGGGKANAFVLTTPFFAEERTIYYNKYKLSKLHNDFSDFEPIVLTGTNAIPVEISKVLLCNNNTYSAGNYFSYIFKDLTHCKVIGEQCGGGGGCITEVYLPNGWILRYTIKKSFNTAKLPMENGLKPDIEVIAPDSFWLDVQNITGEDPQLQSAINYLTNKSAYVKN